MALETIAEANQLARTTLVQAVIETIVEESPFLSRLPYMGVLGTGLTYNRELSPGAAQFYAPGDTWVEGTPTFTTKTSTLKIAGGDADVDKFLRKTRSNENDLKAEVITLKSKALARLIQEELVYGDVDDDALGFDGLHAAITDDATDQQVHAGATTVEGAGSLTELQEMLHLIRPGKPDFLMGPRKGLQQIGTIARSLGSEAYHSGQIDVGNLRLTVNFFDGVPYFINDFQSITETISSGAYATKTGGTGYTIFAVRVGPDGLMGLHDGSGVQVEEIGTLETKDAERTRIKFYNSLALFGTLAVARYDGIDTAQAWTN